MKMNWGREGKRKRERVVEMEGRGGDSPGKGVWWEEEKGVKTRSWTSHLSALQDMLELTTHT